jgi:hypothetical protein
MSQLAVALATLDTEIEGAISGKMGVAEWVRATARDRGIRFASHPVDVFADAVSRLSDADVRLDPIEQLLLALERAGVVGGRQGVLLHAAYLRQRT